MHTRRLAAIMFTDIVGYTAIMQSDEAKALEIRSRHREVFEEFHQKHNGTILQYYGDGTLSIFDSAIEAATCAIAMQLAFQQEPKVPLRIGIHTGDILFSKEEALGDGVNVASRIESMAVQGSVMVSDTVKEYLKNQPDIPLKSMGSYQFKNVERKMEVFAIDREGLNIPDPNELTGKFAPKTETKKPLLRRIPVWGQYLGGFLIFLILAPFLYFPIFNLINGNARETTNITNENGEKIKREIINFKDKKRFWVTSFDNLDGNEENNWLQIGFPYALEMDWDQDPYVHNVYSEHNLGQNLRDHIKGAENADCEYILQGAYSHDSLYHVIIKILDAKTGKKEFELSFDEKELFPLMDHISLQVKKTLGVPEDHLAGTIDLPVAQFLTESEEAYKVFIGGMYGKGNYSTLALEAYTKATEIDPTFAWASYMVSMFHHRFQRSDRKAKIFIDQAMAHRSRLPDIFEIDVRILNYKVKGEDGKALELTEALTQLNPGNTIYLNDLTNEYFDQDEYEKLLETIKKQRKVTGKTTLHQEREIIAFLRIGEVNKAKKIAEKMVEESPEDIKALYRLGIVQLADEEWEEARRIFEKINLFAPEEKHIDKVFEHISFMEDSADLVDFPDLYQKFVGRYWVEEFANFQIDMIDINGFLFAYPTSQSKMAMYALSPYKYSTFQGFDIEFIPDE
ncbi:MAG: hypothetical protein KDD99_21090, partial [Bacteroidetes bacterium]|nr:hypothetical protein [Bacteroidota bacterium]